MNIRTKIYLLIFLSLALAAGAGWVLKTHTLARPQLLGWSFILIGGCISTVRGIQTLGKIKK